MILPEPRVEFVPIDENVFTQAAASACPNWATQTPTGGGQRCIASQVDAHYCDDFDTEIPWLD